MHRAKDPFANCTHRFNRTQYTFLTHLEAHSPTPMSELCRLMDPTRENELTTRQIIDAELVRAAEAAHLIRRDDAGEYHITREGLTILNRRIEVVPDYTDPYNPIQMEVIPPLKYRPKISIETGIRQSTKKISTSVAA